MDGFIGFFQSPFDGGDSLPNGGWGFTIIVEMCDISGEFSIRKRLSVEVLIQTLERMSIGELGVSA